MKGKFLFITACFILMTACTANETGQQNDMVDHPYMRLSTDQNQEGPENQEPNQLNDLNDDEGITPDYDEEDLQDDIGLEPDNDQDQVPEEETIETDENEEHRIDDDPRTEIDFANLQALPFEDFDERWNAVSDEQFSELYIHNYEDVSERSETIYRAQLTPYLFLDLFVYDNYIYQLQMVGQPSSEAQRFGMLTGWSQIVYILHPEFEVYDVDPIFHEIGVGPNADLSNVSNSTFHLFDLRYDIEVEDGTYIFTATYEE
ncbi:hypothetical protein [Alkalibacillus aidingensis]|uniref:hypothetical protein n=1 Tax=Alkalibacillus aidingensis TaxID=2747607 RepID=UPI0016612E44|nr:hypothetical protein [Alkalibacillus aidingensis]